MMKKSSYIKAIADGILQGFCATKLLLGITFSHFASELPLKIHIVIGCLIALITATIYFLWLHNERENKNLLKVSAISFLFFAISSPILFTLPFSILPQREIGDADGIGMMLIFSIFFIVAVVVRLGIFIGVLIRNKKKS